MNADENRKLCEMQLKNCRVRVALRCLLEFLEVEDDEEAKEGFRRCVEEGWAACDKEYKECLERLGVSLP